MQKVKSQLVKETDRVFSLYIRNRGAYFGRNHCFTCGAYLLIEELQCGHFRPRRFLNTRWHPVNCWPQCNRCNVELGGNLKVYENKLVALYGRDAIDGLFVLSNSYEKITEGYLREIINEYKQY